MINHRKNYSIGFISLGCDKNRVDLEKMIALIKDSGYLIESNEKKADVIIINTCSFIQPAREESIENILQISQFKETNLKKLIVTGCLNHMNYVDLEESLPEVDSFVRVEDNVKIVEIIDKLLNIQDKNLTCLNRYSRILTTPSHYAYLKISEGCDNFCTYCKIPYIRGRYHSYSLDDIFNEAELLVSNGVSELILVAQDVTKYGLDFNNGTTIVSLIKKLSSIERLKKIRLLYCYPELITDELIQEIKNNNKVCKYIDIPMQHISDSILKKMNRKGSKTEIVNKIEKIKNIIPNIAIRSTFIVGFPGETNADFSQLCEFVEKYKLNNVGFFAYSREEGTAAFNFDDQLDERVKEERIEKLASIQFNNVKKHNHDMIGKVLEVVVDDITNSRAICRSEFECPEIDGVIFIKNANNLKIGNYYKVIITNSKNYDLEGEIYEKFTKSNNNC